ncbi:hypothetical protein HS041_04430 [Planomonospora sp. ID67723]|uniref:hypothetical protein n=1 Tax=Planomonospora sp. ID67723 TaxID=2738134 RepID=UPI0018C38188|nr:hypothetical protein [Planomonospora sp. ID67723]MBG0827009.1 hypothetical protein [Planomonospora sp. ID67723]
MGLFFEYYRAADREAALVRPEASRAIEEPHGVSGFDVVEAKWIDTWGTLNKLVAIIADADLSTKLVTTVALYPSYPSPAPQSDEEWDALPDDSPYLSSVGIEELSVNVRDLLAGADDARLPMLVERWAKIEEFSAFSSVDMEYLRSVAEDLVGLSRRAREHGQQLYCWSCA